MDSTGSATTTTKMDSTGSATTTTTLPLPYRKKMDSTGSATTTTTLSLPLSDIECIRRIGSGSSGTVWMARHRSTNQIYAVKIIHGNHDDVIRQQMVRELEILRTADNPFVIRCHGTYDNGSVIRVLLEYMNGGSLDGRCISDEASIADIACQALLGLAYLHKKKIVHRDIKPANILINKAGQVKIADFGVSRILAQTMDPCSSSVGSIAYMSPERINDEHGASYDGCAGDIWSFGLSFLELLLGEFPYSNILGGRDDWPSLMYAICLTDPPQAPPTATAEFRSFIASCLQKDPASRFTAHKLLQHPFIAQSPLLPPPATTQS